MPKYLFAVLVFVSMLLPTLSEGTEPYGASPDLAALPTFRSSELQAFIEQKHFPSTPEDPEYQKLEDLFYSYDLQQPTQTFTLKKRLRVASLNITRGYGLEKLKLIFRENPAVTGMLTEFPEVACADTFDQAKDSIIRYSKSHSLNYSERIMRFYAVLDGLLDPTHSQFVEIFCPKKIYRCKEQCNDRCRCWKDYDRYITHGGLKKYKYIFQLAKQIQDLYSADVVAMQEVDWGMPRTDYKHIIKELADSTGRGYVFGTEFVELLDEGIPYNRLKDPVEEEHFRGLHGNAILSKFPMSNVRVVRYRESFTEDPSMKEMGLQGRRCYNWWKEELPKIGPFEALTYQIMEAVVNERAIPSLRLGSRFALVADVQTADGVFTFASTHMENRGSVKCRREELRDLLTALKETTPDDQAVMIGGDMNTTSEEARRPYLVHVLYWHIKNQLDIPVLLANVAQFSIGAFVLDLPNFVPTPIPIASVTQMVNQARKWRNPAGFLVPERKLFRKILDKFEFYDGTVFDTRGNLTMNSRSSTRMLSNSNATTPVGYKPTYCFNRNYKHLFCMKLDWIFVKPLIDKRSRKITLHDYVDNTWAPLNPKTLYALSVASEISDHGAVTTDILLPSNPYYHRTCSLPEPPQQNFEGEYRETTN